MHRKCDQDKQQRHGRNWLCTEPFGGCRIQIQPVRRQENGICMLLIALSPISERYTACTIYRGNNRNHPGRHDEHSSRAAGDPHAGKLQSHRRRTVRSMRRTRLPGSFRNQASRPLGMRGKRQISQVIARTRPKWPGYAQHWGYPEPAGTLVRGTIMYEAESWHAVAMQEKTARQASAASSDSTQPSSLQVRRVGSVEYNAEHIARCACARARLPRAAATTPNTIHGYGS